MHAAYAHAGGALFTSLDLVNLCDVREVKGVLVQKLPPGTTFVSCAEGGIPAVCVQVLGAEAVLLAGKDLCWLCVASNTNSKVSGRGGPAT